MKKKIIKKSELKKIDIVHNAIDNLYFEKTHKNFSIPEIKKEEITEQNDDIIINNITKNTESNNIEIDKKKETIISQKIIPTALENDISKHDEHIINESTHSDLTRAFDHLSNPVNLESGTILSNRQVIALSVINYIAQAYDVNFFRAFVKTFPRYRISGDDGRGRKEIIEIANAIRKDREQEQQRFMELLGRK